MTKATLPKYLLDKTTSGVLTPQSLKELTASPDKEMPSAPPTIIQMRDMMGWPAKDITKNELLIEDRIIKGHIPTRFYRKKALTEEILPVLVFIHGGGFFGGSIHNVEQICRTFADRGDVAVVSVGYRLTPENPFPAGLLDCYNTIEYLATNAVKEKIDKEAIFVSGDSAGGNLTLTVSLLDHGYFRTNYVKKIVAYYPVVDMTTNGTGSQWDVSEIPVKDDTERQLVHDYILSFAAQDVQVDEWYGGKLERKNPLLSPLFASDELLKVLPPVKIIIGEFDPLKLQVDVFVERLEKLGNDFEYIIYNGLLHAFMDKIGDYDQAEAGAIDGLEFLLKER